MWSKWKKLSRDWSCYSRLQQTIHGFDCCLDKNQQRVELTTKRGINPEVCEPAVQKVMGSSEEAHINKY